MHNFETQSFPVECKEKRIAKWSYNKGNNPDWTVKMSTTDSGHPIRKSLRRKLTNGDPFDNYGGFINDDATPTYTLLFNDNPGCTYYLEFLEGQFFTQYSGQSVTVTCYLNGKVVKQVVCTCAYDSHLDSVFYY